MPKTKIAIFDLTGCEGCEFHLFSLDELLMDFFQDFEITNWRLLSEKATADFDVAFVEGAVTTKEQVKLLKQIRQTSKIVVALGACAVSGNVFAQIPENKRKEIAEKIYGKDYKIKAGFLKPVEEFIKVDEKILGCPPDIDAFKKVIEKLKENKVLSPAKKVNPPDFTAKIEGHGTLKINFKAKRAEFDVEESERLVEGLLLGRDILQAPYITSRICGICPTAHNLCSFLAIENALSVKISEETILLRRMLLAGQIIKSHLLHLFFLVLPDLAGLKSSINLSKKYPAEFHLMLNIKRTADKILQEIGGSATFPSNTILGGFKNIPSQDKLFSVRDSIYEVIDEAEDLINLFSKFKTPELSSDTKLICLVPFDNSYPFYPGKFTEEIKEIVKRDSTAKRAFLKNGEIIKIGALARISHFSEKLMSKARKTFSNLKLDPKNPFNNNLAQAIEILHLLEETVYLIEKLSKRNLDNAKGIEKIPLPSSIVSGLAYIEAPRGVLFHSVKIDPQGKITDYNIIPPTQINLASLEKEANELIKNNKKSLPKITKEIEQLIRAFDPCITCAVH